MTIPVYKAYLYDKSNSFIVELPFDSLDVSLKLNDIWTAQITLDYTILKRIIEIQNNTIEDVLTSGFRWVDIKRNELTIFRGILNEPRIAKSGDNVSITLPFKSWLAYFTRRYITKTYTDTDAGAIAWDMINTAQSQSYGNIGITQGTIQATKNRDRTFNDDEIAKNIIGMSSQNIKDGFDFEITNNKVFTVATRLGTDKPEIVLDYSNIESFDLSYMVGLQLSNKYICLGNGIGQSQLREIRTASSVYLDKWYLLEDKLSALSVSEISTLQDKGDKALSENQNFNKKFKLTIRTNNIDPITFNIGDSITVKIIDFVNGLYRIKTKVYRVSQGVETINLEFL